MRIEKIKGKCQKISEGSAGLQRYLFKSLSKLICTHRRKSPKAAERAERNRQKFLEHAKDWDFLMFL